MREVLWGPGVLCRNFTLFLPFPLPTPRPSPRKSLYSSVNETLMSPEGKGGSSHTTKCSARGLPLRKALSDEIYPNQPKGGAEGCCGSPPPSDAKGMPVC